MASNITSEAITTFVPDRPQTWWEQQADQMKDTPWWYETPALQKPLQQGAWYLPAVKAAPLEYVNTSPKVTILPAGFLIGAVLLGALIWNYAD